jgi:CRISPR-associated protein Cmr3
MQSIWLAIDPIDTLFFRGAESMVAGENHEVDSLFPPMPATIIGAIRTAILGQNGIAPVDYLKNPESWRDRFPCLGLPEAPGFELSGPLFVAGDDCLLLPAPSHWFADTPEKKKKWEEKFLVQAGRPLTGSPLGLTGSTVAPVWLHTPIKAAMKPLAGWWATAEAFTLVRQGQKVRFTREQGDLHSGEAAILPASALFLREERVGIALTAERIAKEGHLYSTVHVRLREGVRILAGVVSEYPFPLSSEGILQLGGEQRICRYQVLSGLKLPEEKSGSIGMTLSPLAVSDLPNNLSKVPRASGKLLRIGGWDMARGFHKPMTAWLPAGTVFFADNNELPMQLLMI